MKKTKSQGSGYFQAISAFLIQNVQYFCIYQRNSSKVTVIDYIAQFHG